jgi:hypothetical protein
MISRLLRAHHDELVINLKTAKTLGLKVLIQRRGARRFFEC